MSDRFMKSGLAEVRALLDQPRKIVITTHHRPDGDAMGSSLALYNYLKQKNHQADVIIPSEDPEFLHWLPGRKQVLNYPEHHEQAKSLIQQAELIFCLDFNWLNRIDKLEQPVRGSGAKKILIDHHLDPEKAFDYIFSFPTASSTSELVYEFIDSCGDKAMIGKDIAECLYCGIMTDTNSFRFESMKAVTHRIIADLMEAGAQNFRIHEEVYDNFSENRLRLIGYSLKEKLTVLNEFKAAYICLSQAEQDMFNFQTGDSEGLVNYALSIRGIRLAAFFTERDGQIKISLRSKGSFSVKEMAAKYFNGGGHRNASGGHLNASMDNAVKTFLDILPHYKKELNS